jgi:hypothetical protein
VRRIALALLCAHSLACATILTKSQVKAVDDFASATNGYEELPPQVIRAWDEIRLTGGVLAMTSVGTGLPGVDALGSLERKVDQSLEFQADANELRSSLEILKQYTALLKTLTSDDYTNETEARAKDLGRSCDGAVNEYNKVSGKSLPKFASIAAAAIEGLGSIYLRVRQGMYLKEYVAQANKALPKILERVHEILGVADVAAERARLGNTFAASAQAKGTLGYAEAQAIADLLRKQKATEKLVASVQAATDSYIDAHAELAAALLEKKDLKGRLDVVTAFSDRVRAAIEVKKALDR